MRELFRCCGVPLLLIAVTAGVFWPILGHQFVNYDDEPHIVKNVHVNTGISAENVSWAFTSVLSGSRLPLTWFSHMLDVEIYGVRPWGHHLTNLLLHMANTVLLFLLFRRMTGFQWKSAMVAALFALHPLHVESVAWAVERKDVLSGLFWILTIWAYVRYVEAPGVRRYLPVLILFTLGLMSKPMLVTLPFVLLLLDYWPLGRTRLSLDSSLVAPSGRGGASAPPHGTSDRAPGRRLARPGTIRSLLLEKAPLLGLTAAASVVTYLAQHQAGAMGAAVGRFPTGVRLANAVAAYTGYIRHTVWPQHLAVFYPHPEDGLPVWLVVGSALVIVTVTLLALRAAGKYPYLALGWLWYLGALAPVIGIVQVGQQAMADRYTYLPLIGLFVIIAWGIPDLIGRAGMNGRIGEWDKGGQCHQPSAISHHPFLHFSILPLAAVVSLASLAVCARFQVGHWQDSNSLFSHAIMVTRDNYLAHYNLAVDLGRRRRPDLAAKHYAEVLRIRPQEMGARINLEAAQAAQRSAGFPVAAYEELVKRRPEDARLRSALAGALMERGETDEAIAQYRRAVEIDPNLAEAHNNLGVLLLGKGLLDEAIAHCSEAARINPRLPDAHLNLGILFARQGRDIEAVPELERAVSLAPDYAAAHAALGAVYARQRRTDEAIREYREALRLKSDVARTHANLAVALYEKGEYGEAWKEVKLSRELGGSLHPDFLKALSERMTEP